MAKIKRQCKITGKDFFISDWEQEFLTKRGFPLPTLCIEERHRRRLAHRNERRLYNTKCSATGEPMISLYSPDKNLTVYSQDFWWSDKWDPRDYGRDFDFNKPFFEQFKELQQKVPRLSLANIKAENSKYCNNTISNKNCYLVFGADFNEDCLYNIFSFHSRDCCDSYWINRCELCYECTDCNDCYNCKFCAHAYNCKDSAFLYDCKGCSNCFGCMGLRNKKYHFFNKEYSKEEYEQKVSQYNLRTNNGIKQAKEDFLKFKLSQPHRHAFILNCENSDGNNIINAKNCTNCFDIEGPAEDMKDIILGAYKINDALSSSHFAHGAENIYELSSSTKVSNCNFGIYNWQSHDSYYCETIIGGSHNLFGCCSMKKASYCILNKQYEKTEYFDLRNRIIEHMKTTGEWGEFFPMKNSLFAYNETIANDYSPLTKEEAQARGLKWKDEEIKEKDSGDKVPDSIDETDNSIYNKKFVCAETGRPYKVIREEVKLYKKLGVPIPHLAPESRNIRRFNNRGPWKTWQRKCSKCQNKILTSFAPSRPEIIYCEKCYLEEVY